MNEEKLIVEMKQRGLEPLPTMTNAEMMRMIRKWATTASAPATESSSSAPASSSTWSENEMDAGEFEVVPDRI